jgi:small conductance mechanosensitive channel
MTEKIKKRFDEAGISIPFPQRDIHVYEHKE